MMSMFLVMAMLAHGGGGHGGGGGRGGGGHPYTVHGGGGRSYTSGRAYAVGRGPAFSLSVTPRMAPFPLGRSGVYYAPVRYNSNSSICPLTAAEWYQACHYNASLPAACVRSCYLYW